jgi:hypothetical protein
MSWQDVVFLAGNLGFFLALLPSVFGPRKPAPSTCVLTGSILAFYAVTFLTLGLILSALGSALVALTWAALFAQQSRRI